MASARIKIGRILVPVLVSVLFCAIVAAEFPELLSLTDNTANDLTIWKTNPAARPIEQVAVTLHMATSHFKKPTAIALKAYSARIEVAKLPSSDLLALRSVLRT